jgi:hypothetical protein
VKLLDYRVEQQLRGLDEEQQLRLKEIHFDDLGEAVTMILCHCWSVQQVLGLDDNYIGNIAMAFRAWDNETRWKSETKWRLRLLEAQIPSGPMPRTLCATQLENTGRVHIQVGRRARTKEDLNLIWRVLAHFLHKPLVPIRYAPDAFVEDAPTPLATPASSVPNANLSREPSADSDMTVVDDESVISDAEDDESDYEDSKTGGYGAVRHVRRPRRSRAIKELPASPVSATRQPLRTARKDTKYLFGK